MFWLAKLRGRFDISKTFEKYFSSACFFNSGYYICSKNSYTQMAKQKKKPRNIYFTDEQWRAVKEAADLDVSEVSPFVVRTVMSSIEPTKRKIG